MHGRAATTTDDHPRALHRDRLDLCQYLVHRRRRVRRGGHRPAQHDVASAGPHCLRWRDHSALVVGRAPAQANPGNQESEALTVSLVKSTSLRSRADDPVRARIVRQAG